MLFTILIETDNTAVTTVEHVADLLLTVEGQVRNGRVIGPIHDTNGNNVGEFQLTGVPGRTDT